MDGMKKTVKFDLNLKVYHQYVWCFAYKQSRKGLWEQFARDRDRFNRRIERDKSEIALILSTIHREKIYRQRFQNF